MMENFVAQRITQLRLLNNISEYSLSYALGKSKSYIGNITSGKSLPSMPMFFALCDFFGIEQAQFFAPEYDDDAKKLLMKFNELNDEDRQFVAKLIETLLSMKNCSNKNTT
ncbi:MAG: helix-turn-helix domain-containing protein [Clostridia bacterium]|nr:helix-turn-helix domain-containing protein [Clostridia bacterium]